VSLEGSDLVDVQISTERWELVEVDAFVCPTNSAGAMTVYPTSKIKELAGPEVEALVKRHTPLAVGAALVTSAGRMRARHLIHVPNTNQPGGEVRVEDVLRATAAVIVACGQRGFTSLATPLMGAFENGIPAEEAARAIHSEFRAYRGDRPLRVLFMAKDADEVEVFELALEGAG
jgi:O-acetyl-ADP-ribose deacetylase (regulator of RNase III)